MALTKEKKQAIVDEAASLLGDAKMTVIAAYPGTSVKAMQELRRSARVSGTNVKIFKNRLVKLALNKSAVLKDVDTSVLRGQLLYAFNADDEVAPAQALANFAKSSPTLEFIGGITESGVLLSSEDVKALASLPTKEQLRAQLAGTLAAPLSGFAQVLSGNLRGVLGVLSARAEAL